MKLLLTLLRNPEFTHLSEWCRRADGPFHIKDAFIDFRFRVINFVSSLDWCPWRLLHDTYITDSPNLEFYYSVWISLTSSWHTLFCNSVGSRKCCAKDQAKYPISRAVSGNITHLSFLFRAQIRRIFSSTMDILRFGVADSFPYFSCHYLQHFSISIPPFP